MSYLYIKHKHLQPDKLEQVHEDEWERTFASLGYGRLKFLRHFIERKVSENSQLCVDGK